MTKRYTCRSSDHMKIPNGSNHFLSKNTIDKWVFFLLPIVLLDWAWYGLLNNVHVTLQMKEQMKNELLDIFHGYQIKRRFNTRKMCCELIANHALFIKINVNIYSKNHFDKYVEIIVGDYNFFDVISFMKSI